MALHPMPTSREEWLAARMHQVGASEVSALWDIQPDYALSRYALWHVKARTAEPPDVGSVRTRWGQRLEEVVAIAAAEERGWTVRKGRRAICDDCPRLAASLDFEIEADPLGEYEGPGVLETKNVDWLVHRRSWTDGEPPLHILLQLQAQLAATGWSWGAVAALVGGNDLRIYPYRAKPNLIADIKARVAAFWQSIEEGKPPPVDGSDAASDVLRQLYAERVDDVIDMTGSNEWPEAVAEFLKAGEDRKAANKRYDLTKNRVAALLGSHMRGFGEGYSVNVVVVPDNPGRPAEPGEIVGKRAGSVRYNAKEYA